MKSVEEEVREQSRYIESKQVKQPAVSVDQVIAGAMLRNDSLSAAERDRLRRYYLSIAKQYGARV